ncbi:MAG TPA: 50S ribosomal protein L25 [Dehalococcoidia bacterium]|nr:50S ribosomal protein L25 [Dehalococcoidia bacterium]
MTTQAIKLELEPRDLLGKKVQRLRRAGIIPVHLYGPDSDSRPLQCQSQKLIQVLSLAGGNTAIEITIQGESGSKLAFAREIQWEPMRDTILHVDFLLADINRPVTAQVPIVLIGESAGARSVGGSIVHQLRQLDVQALPLEMPGQIEIDLSALTEADGVIRVSDIELSSNVTVLTDLEELVIRIELPRAEVEFEPAEGGEGAEVETQGEEESTSAEED